MTDPFLFSEDSPPFGWSDAESQKLIYGPKGALLAVLPRSWTPEFVLVPATFFRRPERDGKELLAIGNDVWSRIASLAGEGRQLIVRSSVLGESIWDRGTYQSILIQTDAIRSSLPNAVAQVLASAQNKPVGIVIQRYVQPRARGEFGNLLRISKTRDQWELSTDYAGEGTSRIRFNTQRDEAASADSSLTITRGRPQERLFGSVAAWLNNELLRGHPQRLNSEWITDNKCIYIVQIDEEDDDHYGVNPFQINIPPFLRAQNTSGSLLIRADKDALDTWDKLKVLDELWEQDSQHKPVLFFVPLSDLPQSNASQKLQQLEQEFRTQVGPDSIIVRTSGRANAEKSPNLPRTECLRPSQAVEWCIQQRDDFDRQGLDLRGLAFVTHRFIASKASAWARATPGNPSVEIHGLWGLPDALQYCPYDIWEVHVPTEVATEYPEYKSNMLIPRSDGGWQYVRIKNDLARFLSIGRREALEIAKRSLSIAERIGKPCHIMWFVDCVESDGTKFSMPWYWIEGYEAQKNLDRTNYRIVTISDPASLEVYKNQTGSRARQAIELRPTDLNLMRDTRFIDSVGAAAAALSVPVVLSGSTLAHAYYQLRRQGCTVVTRGEKEYSRVRKNIEFGKLVRDKIPARIARRKEAKITRRVPDEILKGFLISKLIEEALEVRNAETPDQKIIELADLYEVFRALARLENVSLERIATEADQKKKMTGGFDEGLILLQTGVLGPAREAMQDAERPRTQVLARKMSDDTYEIPLSFFGFMEFDQMRSLIFDGLGIRIGVVLKGDRIELHASKEAEQFELPMDLTLTPAEEHPAPTNARKRRSRKK